MIRLGGVPGGDAYARLIEDCILGDQTLFTRSDAVEASWHFFDPDAAVIGMNIREAPLVRLSCWERGDLWRVRL